MKLNKLAIICLSAFGFSSMTSAHTIWVARVYGEQAISYGHSAADSDAYNPDKIERAYGFKTNGDKVDLNVEKTDNHAFLANPPEDLGIAVVEFNNGYWSQDKNGEWINKRGDQVDGADGSNKYSKETVAYLNPRIKPTPAGLKLEIVPEVNPSTLGKGDDLKFQVLFDGKPVEGAQVTSNYFDHDAPVVTTDKDGFAILPVISSNFNILETGYEVDTDDPYENERYSSTLSFQAKNSNDH